MQTTAIQEELHRYIDNGDEKLLKLMLVLAKDYTGDDDFDHDFTAEDIEALDRYREKRLSGENKTYSWEDAKKSLQERNHCDDIRFNCSDQCNIGS